ncbi:MAG: hypothetical protein NVS9B14_04590 [Candidatus Acidiferrum sp.]
MDWRVWLLENFAGDLEYHPKRGFVYLGLGILAILSWYFAPSDMSFATLALVFALGGVGLIGKAIFLFRKSSEALGLTIQDEVLLEESAKNKKLARFPSQVAQIGQDFGTGVIFLALFFGSNRGVVGTSAGATKLELMLIGSCVFAVGWFVRWLLRQTDPDA